MINTYFVTSAVRISDIGYSIFVFVMIIKSPMLVLLRDQGLTASYRVAGQYLCKQAIITPITMIVSRYR